MKETDMIRTAHAVDKKVEALAALCRQRGIKATHQRTEIYRELAATEEHPDAETIFRRVKKRIPAISFDTVYRTLRTLEDEGLIARVGTLGERMRFDANQDHHHHFVCTACGLMKDFYSEDLNTLAPPSEVARWGKIQGVHVELRGLCTACQRKTRK